jgi:hypothetical protein
MPINSSIARSRRLRDSLDRGRAREGCLAWPLSDAVPVGELGARGTWRAPAQR